MTELKRLNGSRRQGHEWVFWVDQTVTKPAAPRTRRQRRRPAAAETGLDSSGFEQLARRAMSIHLGVPLTSGKVPGVPKQFDMVSSDHQIVGDAKYYTLVRGKRLPPAKFATIAEHVWLLEKTGASTTFLVFGNQREVLMQWLERYGDLASGVDFYFLTDGGELDLLTRSSDA